MLVGFLATEHRKLLRLMTPGIAFIVVIAVTYTTPWDNYLVYKQVWWYGADRVLGTIGYVPIEEYAFFVLQTILTGLFLTWRLSKRPDTDYGPPENYRRSRLVGGLVLTGITVLGALALAQESTLYLGLILAWAGPILLLQWILGYRALMGDLKTWLPVVALATIYLGAADLYAISSGIWKISERYTTGLHIAGLPMEEGLFFLVTNLLVGWGLLLYHDFVTNGRLPKP